MSNSEPVVHIEPPFLLCKRDVAKPCRGHESTQFLPRRPLPSRERASAKDASVVDRIMIFADKTK